MKNCGERIRYLSATVRNFSWNWWSSCETPTRRWSY